MRTLVLFIIIWCFAAQLAGAQENIDEKLPESAESTEIEISGETATQGGGVYAELDFGIPLLLFPHNTMFDKYRDADHNIGFRIATSVTYDRFRFELGYLTRSLNQGERSISSYDGVTVTESTSQAKMAQTETLLYWLRNDPHRVSYIGGGPIRVSVRESYYLETDTGTRVVDQTITANGWKLVVGGKDTDSRLKTYFSYTWAKANPELGTNYYIGGYSIGWSLSLGGP